MARKTTNTTLGKNASINADQVEWKALIYGNTNLDSGFDDELFSGSTDDYESEGAGLALEFSKSDRTKDNAASNILSEINRRMNYLGENYPFRLANNNLKFIGSSTCLPHVIYIFLLAVSNSNTITKGNYVELPRDFELLCTDLVKWHFGHYAKSLHVGWPRSHESHSRTFQKLYEETVSPETGEWVWKPTTHADPTTLPGIKDEGLDFLVWVESPDSEKGKLFITGQCACGNDWDTKYDDIDPEFKKLGKWFGNEISWIRPVRAFGIPFCISENDRHTVSSRAGLFYDRIRLTLLSKGSNYLSSLKLSKLHNNILMVQAQ